jgi:hypothetical protein
MKKTATRTPTTMRRLQRAPMRGFCAAGDPVEIAVAMPDSAVLV